ncbi:hypothetical protein [Streptomyces laurentii]
MPAPTPQPARNTRESPAHRLPDPSPWAKAALELKAGQRTSHPELFLFTS